MPNPLQIVSVIAVIRNTLNHKYLLVQRSTNDDIFPLKWQNLGGKIELGEDVEFALKREIEEEIGVKMIDIKPIFLQSYSWKKDEKSNVRLGLIFLIEIKEDISIELSEELNSYGWYDLEEIEKLDTIGKESPTGTIGQIKVANNLQG